MRIKPLLQHAQRQLNSRLDAEILLAHLLNKPRSYLIAHGDDELSVKQEKDYLALISRRHSGEPIAYIVGFKEFWSLNFAVDSSVLIPRADSELLVEQVLYHCSNKDSINLLELGAGSGAIAVAIGSERPNWHITAVDNSERALKLAQLNAFNNGVNNITFVESDWFSKLTGRQFDLIVSNPPYVAEGDPHLDAISCEPVTALVSGKDGLRDIRYIIKHSQNHLFPDGMLMLEHGFNQGASVRAIFNEHNYISNKSILGFMRIILRSSLNVLQSEKLKIERLFLRFFSIRKSKYERNLIPLNPRTHSLEIYKKVATHRDLSGNERVTAGVFGDALQR